MDGGRTLNENIADVGGYKAAYGAYKKLIESQPMLPNLNYSPDQLFWISAAHTLCTVNRPEFDKNYYEKDEHSPLRYRIIGAFTSLTQFARDFNCPSDSAMNPKEKCEIW